MKKTFLVLLLILYFFSGANIITDAEVLSDESVNVLVIHSYHEDLEWCSDIQAGIFQQLDTERFQIFTEYMDCYRIYDPQTYDNFFHFISNKYSSTKIDMIVVADNDAYDFMHLYYDQLFDEQPVVFVGVNNLEKDTVDHSRYTGFGQSGSEKETIDLILQVNNQIERIILCGNDTNTAQNEAAYFESLNPSYKNVNLESLLTTDIDSQIEALKNYDKRTALIVSGISKTRSGEILYHSEYAKTLMDVTGLQVYATSTIYMNNNGAIGGMVIDGFDQGVLVGNYLLDLSNGIALSSLPIVEKPQAKYVFNYQRLEAYGISRNLLPTHEIIGMPGDRIEVEKGVIYTVALFLGLLLFFSVFLSVSNKRRRKAEHLVTEQNMELEAFNEELIASADELNRQYEELATKNQEIEFLAYYDTVTTLMKKERLMEILKLRLSQNKSNMVVMYNIDIRNLNDIVDTFGMSVEDPLLKETANRIIEFTLATNYLTGVYHDEFIIIHMDLDSEEVPITESQELLNLLSKPIIIEDREIDLKICIGYSLLPKFSHSADELLIHSDMARMEAERYGIDQIKVFCDCYQEQILSRVRLEKSLIESLNNKEFSLYYQPKVDIKTGAVIGFEALIRWIKPSGEVVSPNSFIPVAEETGLIVPIGKWVLIEACKQLKEWNQAGYNYSVSVNVSTIQLEDENFLLDVRKAIETYGIKKGQLELEITETTIMHDLEGSRAVLRSLADMGAKISLDDFGSGYSSMTYIRTLPITKIKIDKLFIDECFDKKQMILVGAMIQIGKALDFTVNVEGVETLDQLKRLSVYDIDEVQGFYFARPLPLIELENFLEHHDNEKVLIAISE